MSMRLGQMQTFVLLLIISIFLVFPSLAEENNSSTTDPEPCINWMELPDDLPERVSIDPKDEGIPGVKYYNISEARFSGLPYKQVSREKSPYEIRSEDLPNDSIFSSGGAGSSEIPEFPFKTGKPPINMHGTSVHVIINESGQIITSIPAESVPEEGSGKELAFGPETFEALKKDPNFIAAYGRMPYFENQDERKKWLDSLNTIYSEANDNYKTEMSQYFYPAGPVVSYGYTYRGVLKVELNKEVEKSFTDEIYQTFDSHAGRLEITEVPLVFFHGHPPVSTMPPTTELPEEAPVFGSNINIAQSSETGQPTNKESTDKELTDNGPNDTDNAPNGNESTNSIPGFGSIAGILCFFCLYLVSRLRL